MSGSEKRKKRALAAAVILFAAVQAALLFHIKALEMRGLYDRQNLWEYCSILLDAALAAVLFCCTRPDRMRVFLLLALLFTAAADYSLTYLDARYLTGVILFCAVQTCYLFATWISRRVLFLRMLLFLMVLAGLYAAVLLDPLSAFSAYSITQLLCSVICAASLLRRNRTRRLLLLTLGLTLFLGCDICVGLYNLGAYLPAFPQAASDTAFFLIWCFYLPAQAILPWCLLPEKKRQTLSA
ncbi:MAG: hypothetical protein IJJ34_05775 [Clostridia bacterium]|nr:hypothetical protein [Clostridia bacterium]